METCACRDVEPCLVLDRSEVSELAAPLPHLRLQVRLIADL